VAPLTRTPRPARLLTERCERLTISAPGLRFGRAAAVIDAIGVALAPLSKAGVSASDEALHRTQTIVASALAAEDVRAEEHAEHRVREDADWEPVQLPPLSGEAGLVSEHHGTGPWGAEAEPDRVQAHFELASRHAAQAFASELASEGYDLHQAESFVFIFADDGAAARKLGATLKERAPANAQLFFEGEGHTLFL
jgi:hypothetical protein